MKRFFIFTLALNGLAAPAQTSGLLTRIAFGSGLDTDKPQPIWSAVETSQPQMFLFLGNSVGSNAFATTDCRIWSAQKDGYSALILGPPGRQFQVILLNTSTSREPAAALPNAEQWTWFREQLRKPAQIRIVGSAIPVASEDHRGLKWADWPRDRKLLFDMISDTEADGILFISGNRHHAELSMINDDAPCPLYDLTSSPMNTKTEETAAEINRHGISDVVRDNNFGLITIDWSQPDPAITLEIRDEKGTPRIQHEITLGALQAASPAP